MGSGGGEANLRLREALGAGLSDGFSSPPHPAHPKKPKTRKSPFCQELAAGRPRVSDEGFVSTEGS